MLRGLYIAATGMITQQIKQESTSNNLVNANTPGFKRDETVMKSFPEVMLAQAGNGEINEIGGITQGALVDETITNQSMGALEETGRTLDFALAGKGYFTLETPQGQRYTRNGGFQLNSQGYLVTEQGYYVLGDEGRIKLETEKFSVDPSGSIKVGDEQVASLKVTTFGNPDSLVKEGASLFQAGDTTIANSDVAYTVRQSMLEKSNVDLVKEMVNLMAGVRAYESNQRIIQAYDQMMGKSASEIGRLR